MTKKAVITVLVTMCCIIQLFAQFSIFDGGGGHRLGMGGLVHTGGNIVDVYTNSASIKGTSKWGIDVGAERRFNEDLLTRYNVGGYVRLGASMFHGSMVRSGGEGLVEQKLQLGYARKLLQQVDINGNFVVHQLNLSDFGSKAYLSFDLGLSAKVSNTVDLYALANNPLGLAFDEDISIPSRMVTTIAYSPSDRAKLLIEAEKILDSTIAIKMGAQYMPSPQLSIYLGGDISRSIIALGIGYNFNGIQLDGAYAGHPNLGLYPAMNISYQQL